MKSWKDIFRRRNSKQYTFEHEEGPRHTVWAHSEDHARAKMAHFLQCKMFGDFALWYDEKAVEMELAKCRIVSPEPDPETVAQSLTSDKRPPTKQ